MVKRIAILGSTGSIGRRTIDVARRHPDRFEIVASAAGNHIDLVAEQVRLLRPRLVSVGTEEGAKQLRALLSEPVDIVWGDAGVRAVATFSEAHLVVSAIVGAAGLVPTAAAIEAGKTIALANKETLVAAGSVITELATRHRVEIIPIDSEHSAIHQSLAGHRRLDVKRLIITASGGPFRLKSMDELATVTIDEALHHPNWSMGQKITVDSATLMNKGLEVIEAHWLFGVAPAQIDVVVHPQSIIHSMVEYCDGCVVAQMGVPDMRGPIAYALSYPERVESGMEQLDLLKLKSLTFEPVDHERFPSLKLAYQALKRGGSLPAVLNAANEIAVHAFLNQHLRFVDIPRLVAQVMEEHDAHPLTSIEDVLEVDTWARARGRHLCGEYTS
ncbi:MAG: 1-deoxy-D-xylulose-5-phosphate reductoisomerase [Deltaproteobacteria bacterium]|nr:1-deoxy-D-xylulose-5-phosphate reductoisomerase [Deltaproteobacteria bacterium]